MKGLVFAIAILLILSGCIPPTQTPTAHPPTVTASPRPPTVTPVVSPPVTPTPVPSPIEMPVPATLPIPPTVITQALVNGGMNLPYIQMPGYSTINLPRGWSFGWRQLPKCIPNAPGCPCPTNCKTESGNCNADYGCSWAMPEANRFLTPEYCGQRVMEGDASAKAFTYGRQGRWWYFQTAEVGTGNPVTFTAYLQSWMCNDFADCHKNHSDFGETWVSDRPTTMHLRVGIDPYGGTVVTSTNVVWSPEGDAFRVDKNSPDFWKKFYVSTVSRARYVTVFVYAEPDWSLPALDFPELYDGNYARPNNDVAIDKASLEVFAINPIYKVYLPFVRK